MNVSSYLLHCVLAVGFRISAPREILELKREPCFGEFTRWTVSQPSFNPNSLFIIFAILKVSSLNSGGECCFFNDSV